MSAKITIDASGSTLGSTLVGGLGDPAFTGGNTLLGGSGADLIQVATSAVLNNASIVGGSGTNTVQVTTDAQVVADTDLDGMAGVEALVLSNGANSITLGDKARGIATVAGGLANITIGSGSDTLTATAAFGNTSIKLDGGAGADRFVFDNATQVAAASLIGGLGTDTLSIGQATVLGNDDAFQKVSGMEVLQAAVTGESSFVLDSDAQAAGIRTVIGGSGKGTLNASAYTVDVTLDASANANTAAGQGATLQGGSGNDAFRLLNNNVLSVSSIVGNAGSDTLSFSEDGLSITADNSKNPARLRVGSHRKRGISCACGAEDFHPAHIGQLGINECCSRSQREGIRAIPAGHRAATHRCRIGQRDRVIPRSRKDTVGSRRTPRDKVGTGSRIDGEGSSIERRRLDGIRSRASNECGQARGCGVAAEVDVVGAILCLDGLNTRYATKVVVCDREPVFREQHLCRRRRQ